MQAVQQQQQQRLRWPQQHIQQQRLPINSRQRLVVRAGDHAHRVRGDPRRVSQWLADVRNWTSFYPGTKAAVKLGVGTEPVRVGSKFETTREMLGLKLPMTYEVLQIEPGKRVVLSGLSEHHTQMDQFFLMSDRHDPNFACVRYITNVQLREWRAYLQPLASRFQARVPEEALTSLARVLNGQHSPLYSQQFDAAYRTELKGSSSSSSAGGSRASSSAGGSRGSSRAGTGSSRQAAGASGRLSGGWLRNLISGGSLSAGPGGSAAAAAAAAASSSSSAMPSEAAADPSGFYSVLELSPHSQPDEDELKAAYRRLALQLHPDRQASKSEAERAAAAARFALLLRAYDTLKDPQRRALYDAGQLLEASLNL